MTERRVNAAAWLMDALLAGFIGLSIAEAYQDRHLTFSVALFALTVGVGAWIRPTIDRVRQQFADGARGPAS